LLSGLTFRFYFPARHATALHSDAGSRHSRTDLLPSRGQDRITRQSLTYTPAAGKHTFTAENYDRHRDLYHWHAVFRDNRRLNLPALPVLVRQSTAFLCYISAWVPYNVALYL